MKEKNLLPVFVILVASAAGLALHIGSMTDSTDFSFDVKADIIPESDPSIGIVADSNMNLGRIPQGSEVRKKVNISTNDLILVKISSEGNVSKMLEYDKTVLMNSSSEVEVSFNATEIGYHNGRINVRVIKPQDSLSEGWIRLRDRINY